jgi:hypothetical protein
MHSLLPYGPRTEENSVNNFSVDCWKYLFHPPLSSDLAPSNFHFCGPLKRYLKWKNFYHDDEMKAKVCQCVQMLSPHFFSIGIKCVVYHRDKCLSWPGDYVQKQRVYYSFCFGTY